MARSILSFYPEAKIDMAALDLKLWIAMFRDTSDDDLLCALAEHVRSGNRFAPNAGEIAALCGLSRPALHGLDAEYRKTYEWMLNTVAQSRAEGITEGLVKT